VLVPPAEERPPVGIQPLQLAEWKNEAWAFVPEEYDPAVPYGMLIWLHADGDFDHEEAVDRWREACAQNDLILLLPRPSDPQRWHPDELEFLRALANQLAASYNVDRHRVVAGGHGSGGTLAYMLAFANRDFIHGIAAVGAPMIGPPPPVDPLQPLAVTIYAATESRYAQLINRTIERLREAGYPVTVHSLGQRPRRLDAMERDQLGRWIDMLDRI
jgi:poly(3-hydroxybutyrate) depolymerase